MSTLTFPTRPYGPSVPGNPERASACQCVNGPLTDHPDECIRCGHYLPLVIRRTWHQRAQVIARHDLRAAA